MAWRARLKTAVSAVRLRAGLRVPPSARPWLLMFLKDDAYDDDFSAEVECFQPGWRAEVSFRSEIRLGTLTVETPCVLGSECRVVARIQRGRDRKVVPVEFTCETTRDGHDRLECAG